MPLEDKRNDLNNRLDIKVDCLILAYEASDKEASLSKKDNSVNIIKSMDENKTIG